MTRSEHLDSMDAIHAACQRLRGIEEVMLALLESPNPIEHSIGFLRHSVGLVADDLETAKNALGSIELPAA